MSLSGFCAVVNTYEVQVETLNGTSFCITLDGGDNSVAIVKSEIEKIHGTAQHLQELFITSTGASTPDDATAADKTMPLTLDYRIAHPCKITMIINTETTWLWDAASPLVTSLVGPWHKMYVLQGTKATRDSGPDEEEYEEVDFNNCFTMTPHMESESGKHAISFRLTGMEGYPLFGVVSDAATIDTDCSDPDSAVGWFMSSEDGTLIGNGEAWSAGANLRTGRVEESHIVTLQVCCFCFVNLSFH